jgi:hypothetical protein
MERLRAVLVVCDGVGAVETFAGEALFIEQRSARGPQRGVVFGRQRSKGLTI